MKQFIPTPSMVSAAETLFKAMALVETIRSIVLQYQTDILIKGQWHVRPRFAARLGDEVIVDPRRSYLMSDEDFAEYDAQCKLARDNAKLHVDNDEQCPLLVAENMVRLAEEALVLAMYEHTKLTKDQLLCLGLEKYKQYIDLTLRLLAPFVKNTL